MLFRSIVYSLLFKQLIVFTPEDKEEDPSADDLREKMDVWWHAGDDAMIMAEVSKIIDEMENRKML